MTKGKLIKILEEYPDDAEIEMEFERIDCEDTSFRSLARVYGYETVIGTKNLHKSPRTHSVNRH